MPPHRPAVVIFAPLGSVSTSLTKALGNAKPWVAGSKATARRVRTCSVIDVPLVPRAAPPRAAPPLTRVPRRSRDGRVRYTAATSADSVARTLERADVPLRTQQTSALPRGGGPGSADVAAGAGV